MRPMTNDYQIMIIYKLGSCSVKESCCNLWGASERLKFLITFLRVIRKVHASLFVYPLLLSVFFVISLSVIGIVPS